MTRKGLPSRAKWSPCTVKVCAAWFGVCAVTYEKEQSNSSSHDRRRTETPRLKMSQKYGCEPIAILSIFLRVSIWTFVWGKYRDHLSAIGPNHRHAWAPEQLCSII